MSGLYLPELLLLLCMTYVCYTVLKFCIQGVNESLQVNGVLPSNIFSTFVRSPFDVPVTAKLLAASKRVDVIVALGCLTQDDTTLHFESTGSAVTHGLMQVCPCRILPTRSITLNKNSITLFMFAGVVGHTNSLYPRTTNCRQVIPHHIS